MALSHSINGVCWFLSTLFICYIFSPFLVTIVKKLNTIKKQFLSMGIVTLALLLLSLVFLRIENTFTIGTHKPLTDLFYGSPCIRIWYLLFGMIIANIFISKKDNIKSDLTVLEVIITILTLFYFFFRNSLGLNSIFYRFLDIVVCCTTLIVFSFGKGKISKFLVDNKTLQMLGGSSMYLYLLHYPVRMTVGKMFEHYKIDFGNGTFLVEMGLIVGITIFLCIICKKFQSRLIRK